MTQKTVKRGLIDWIVIGGLATISVGMVVLSFLFPKAETKGECYRRVTREIRDRYYNAGKLTIDTPEEIEAIASEIKQKCP